MKVKLFSVLLLVILISISQTAPAYSAAKDSGPIWFTESGLVTGIGTGSISEGNYEPVLIIWHLSKDLAPYFNSLAGHRWSLSFICEPQVNPVFNPHSDLEFGIGVGLKFRYPITDKLVPYLLGAVGPHYVSVQTKDQASGFIFSNTIGAGIEYRFNRKYAMNIGYRLRHISNAGLKSPNGGINTQFGTAGFSVFY